MQPVRVRARFNPVPHLELILWNYALYYSVCSHDYQGQFDCGPYGDPIPGFGHNTASNIKLQMLSFGLQLQ